MRIVITRETLYDTELESPETWTETVRVEEMCGNGARRLLDLDDPDDLGAYESVIYEKS